MQFFNKTEIFIEIRPDDPFLNQQMTQAQKDRLNSMRTGLKQSLDLNILSYLQENSAITQFDRDEIEVWYCLYTGAICMNLLTEQRRRRGKA